MSGSSNGVVIRPATKEDMVEVAAMIQELADFEKMPHGPQLSVQDLQHDGFEKQPPGFSCVVAELTPEKRLAGFALYFPVYSTWQGQSMVLEDLYVRMDMRKCGIGQKLFDYVAKETYAFGAGSRMDFHVLKWNPARSFYDAKGAINMTDSEDWFLYRLTGDALKKAASNAK